jgi:hypothetical protein
MKLTSNMKPTRNQKLTTHMKHNSKLDFRDRQTQPFKPFIQTIYKLEKKKQYIWDGCPEHTTRSQQLGLPCLSLSWPSSASMSTYSNTSLLKDRMRLGGGDGASAKRLAIPAAYVGSSNVLKGLELIRR